MVLSLSFVTNAYSIKHSNYDTLEFVKGCRDLVKTTEDSSIGMENLDRYNAMQAMGYLKGFIDARSIAVILYNLKMNGIKVIDEYDSIKLLEKEFHGYVLPENFSTYILAKLVINYVDSFPTTLTKQPLQIVYHTLNNEFMPK